MDNAMEIDTPNDTAAGEGEGREKATTTTAKRKAHPTPNPDPRARGPNRTRTLATLTIKNPPWSYAHLTLANPSPIVEATSTSTSASTSTTDAAKTTAAIPEATPVLDMLEIRAYLTAALRQFLGDTGAAIPVDILAVGGRDGDGDGDGVWVRVPRQDLNLFVGAVTAFAGQLTSSTVDSGQGGKKERMVLQVKAAGNWLGSLLGRGQEGKLWAGSDTSDKGGG
ncbi:uncharacterized protein P884DRAFT_257032 [Thermothelomyces heterothallicus CBS 202.75]|uniref:uncharacterized protein n=1 Tax=Thermothelomyces heterothallicus CBS 202.75 TaxID=1149848 RepID=UPI0037425640